MPIQLACSCGKKLQVGDQYAGRKVSCPGCKAVLTVPGTPSAAPTAAPAKAAPAADETPVRTGYETPDARESGPAASPARAEPEESAAGDPFSFGSSTAKPKAADEPEKEKEPKPTSKNWDDEDEPIARGKKDARAKRRDRDDEDDRPRRRGGRDREPDEKAPAKAWDSFGRGSSLARLGLWIEFLALVAGVAMVGYIVVGILNRDADVIRQVDSLGGPFVLAPFFVGTFIGTTLTLVGRTRMMNLPPTAGLKKVFFGAWGFTFLRFFATLAAAVLILMTATEWENMKTGSKTPGGDPPNGFLYFVLAFVAYSISTPLMVLADLSMIPGMALVGGEIPNAPLRRRAALVTFVLQLMVLVYVLAGIGIAAGVRKIELRPDSTATSLTSQPGNTQPGRPPTTTTTPSTTTYRRPPDEGAKSVFIAALAATILVQLVYTLLFSSLYGAGRAAATEAREDEDAAEYADA